MVPFEIRLEEVRPGFDRVAVDFHGSTLRPDRQDSQKGLQAAVRVCHPRGFLLEGDSACPALHRGCAIVQR